MGRVTVKQVTELDQLTPFADAWDRMVHDASWPNPYASHLWVSSYLMHLHDTRWGRWACFLAFDKADRLVGTLPVVRRGTQAEMPHHGHAFATDLAVGGDCAPEVVGALCDAAFAGLGVDRIVLPRVPRHGDIASILAERQVPRIVADLEGQGAYLPVPDDFDRYREGLSRNFRNNLNKARNKLRTLSGVRYSFLRGAAADPDLLHEFTRVEAASWKGREGSAIAQSTVLVRFYTELTCRLADRGWLEWHLLEADGTTLAANLAVRCGRRLCIWKLGYDEGYARCSPGSLLLEALIRSCTEAGDVDEIDLLTDYPWYDNWTMARRPYDRITAYRPHSVTAGVRWTAHRALNVARRVKRTVQRASGA